MATPILLVDQRTVSGTAVDDTNPLPIKSVAAAGGAPSNSATTAYASSLVAKASAGTLYGVAGYNSGPQQFIQLHDAAAVPANGVAPVGPLITVPAASNYSIDFGSYGMRFATGIVVSNSTTGPTKTLGAADCWIAARYA